MSATAATYRLKERGYGTHQALLDLVRPGAELLDVGAAGGYISEIARDLRGARPLAVEVDAASCEASRARGIETLEGDVVQLLDAGAFSGRGPFDQIMLADVLEHIPYPAPVLDRLTSLLAPGGSVIVSLPNIAYLRARLRLLAGVWRYEETGIFDRTHMRFFTRATARELVEGAGLRIVREIPVGPANYLLGRPGLGITRIRPQLLASQLVMEAEMASP
jgi:2-polyprenyl-3-methyl-5-hydroxy-6-metoxy-1,4-benzoquinol methylase